MSLSPATPNTKEMLLIQAIQNDSVIAESAKTVIVEGIHYLSCGTVTLDFLNDSTQKIGTAFPLTIR